MVFSGWCCNSTISAEKERQRNCAQECYIAHFNAMCITLGSTHLSTASSLGLNVSSIWCFVRVTRSRCGLKWNVFVHFIERGSFSTMFCIYVYAGIWAVPARVLRTRDEYVKYKHTASRHTGERRVALSLVLNGKFVVVFVRLFQDLVVSMELLLLLLLLLIIFRFPHHPSLQKQQNVSLVAYFTEPPPPTLTPIKFCVLSFSIAYGNSLQLQCSTWDNCAVTDWWKTIDIRHVFHPPSWRMGLVSISPRAFILSLHCLSYSLAPSLVISVSFTLSQLPPMAAI